MVEVGPTIDRDALVALLEAVGGEQAILEDLAATFLVDIDAQLDELRRGLEAQDAAAVQRAAHSLKSTSASFGATRLADTSKGIEESTQSGVLPAKSAVEALAADAEIVKAELPSAIAAIGASS